MPAMNDHNKLRALVAKWRAKSKDLAAVSYTGATLDRCADQLEAALAALSEQPEAQRDREADRERFPDPGFNEWLDQGISDAGHTVWCAVGDLASAWAGWEARQYHGHPRACLDCGQTAGHAAGCVESIYPIEQPEAQGEAVAWLEPGTLNSAAPDGFEAARQKWPDDYKSWFPVYTAAPKPGEGVAGDERVVRMLRVLGFDGIEELPGWGWSYSRQTCKVESMIENGILLEHFDNWLDTLTAAQQQEADRG